MKKKLLINLIILIILINSFVFLIPTNSVQAANYNQVTINANANNNNGIDAFPESYKKILNNLVQQTGHTNWKFKPFYTDIDWAELTDGSNENRCLRNTIYKTNGSWICSCGRQGDVGYYCASAKIVNYYLDPRNFLTETTIFQFLDLSNSTKFSVADIENAVKGTYLAGSVNGKSYAQMIYDAAEASGQSALSIVVKIFQELGRGTSLPEMIAGKNETYPNVYNFFNYGATDGVGNRLRGLKFAQDSGWDTPEKALIEGAKLITNSYVNAGQNTKYTFKFDIVNDSATGLYSHQYMTNIQDPTNQSKMLYDEYLNNNWLSQELTFIIPVYKNMPSYVKLPSNLTTSDGKLYFVSSNYSSVTLREGIGSNSNSLEQLKKDTVVLMKEYNTNNSGWSKVSVNGKEGYIDNRYLTEVNLTKDTYTVPNQPSANTTNTNADNKTKTEEIKTEKVDTNNVEIKVSDTNILVTPVVTLKDLKAKYKVQEITKENMKIEDTTSLATGTIVKIDNKTYTIVKMGDINGDGYVDTGDTLVAKQVVLGKKEITGVYKIAMDVNKDGYTDTGDTLALKKYILGTGKLEI